MKRYIKSAVDNIQLGNMKCVSNDLDPMQFTSNSKIVFIDNGAYDLEKQGVSGVYLWVGYEHDKTGRSNPKLNAESISVANKVGTYFKKIYGRDYTVDDFTSSTDMVRVWTS